MKTKTVVNVEFPAHMGTKEIRERLDRLRQPFVDARESEKTAERLTIESRELASIGSQVDEQGGRLDLMERVAAKFEERSQELEQRFVVLLELANLLTTKMEDLEDGQKNTSAAG